MSEASFTFGDLRSYIAGLTPDTLAPNTYRKIWHKIFMLPLEDQEVGASYFTAWYQSHDLFLDTFKGVAMPPERLLHPRLLPYLEGIEGVYSTATQDTPYLPQSCKYAYLGVDVKGSAKEILTRKDVLYSIYSYLSHNPSANWQDAINSDAFPIREGYYVLGFASDFSWRAVWVPESFKGGKGHTKSIHYIYALKAFDPALINTGVTVSDFFS